MRLWVRVGRAKGWAFLVAVVALLCGSSATAGEKVVDFDSPASGTMTDFDRYEADGVVFTAHGRSSGSFASFQLFSSSQADTPPNILGATDSSYFPQYFTAPIWMDFTAPTDRVSFFLGGGPGDMAQAYDATGQLLATVHLTNSSPDRHVTFQRPTADIARVVVQGEGFVGLVYIDTVRFNQQGPTLSAPQAEPAVLPDPRAGLITTLKVRAKGPQAVTSVKATVQRPNGTRVSGVLTRQDGTAQDGTWAAPFTAADNPTTADKEYRVTFEATDAAGARANPVGPIVFRVRGYPPLAEAQLKRSDERDLVYAPPDARHPQFFGVTDRIDGRAKFGSGDPFARLGFPFRWQIRRVGDTTPVRSGAGSSFTGIVPGTAGRYTVEFFRDSNASGRLDAAEAVVRAELEVQQDVVLTFTVARHVDARLDDPAHYPTFEAEVTRKFLDIETALRTRDTLDDVRCIVRCRLAGRVNPFGQPVSPPGSPTCPTRARRDAVFALASPAAYIKLVHGPIFGGEGATASGVTQGAGIRNIIISDDPTGGFWDTWAHEIGHSKGLLHTPAPGPVDRVMFTGSPFLRNTLSLEDSQAFRRP